MWKYSEVDAYNSISLHDCRTDDIKIEGSDLVINFPDGFWITPVSKHIDHDRPLKTGPSQLYFNGFDFDPHWHTADLYKPLRLFGKEILCRRIRLTLSELRKLVNDGKHELEFITEYHNSISCLYQCWLWKKDRGMEADCQIYFTAKSIEYRWNEILPDREW